MCHLKQHNPTLPSSIEKQKLLSIEVIIAKYPGGRANLQGESKLAKEAIFRAQVMKQCTPIGSRELPGLPANELKKSMFMQFSQYWNSRGGPEDFLGADFEMEGSKCFSMRQDTNQCLDALALLM